jgi:hypothetical protein
MQQPDAFRHWQRERDAIETEMNALLTGGLPASSEERQVRYIRFQALIERREAAARDLLKFDRSLRHQLPATQPEAADDQRNILSQRHEDGRSPD